MQTKLLLWSRAVYVVGVFLAVLFIIPTAWFPFQLGKVTIFSAALLISAMVYAVATGLKGLQGLAGDRGFKIAWVAALVPLTCLLSSVVSLDRSIALTGYAIDGGTILFAMLCFVAFLMSYIFGANKNIARDVLGATLVASAVAVLFQFAVIVLGDFGVTFSLFADHSVNLVGKWNDLGLLAGLLFIGGIATLEFVSLSRVRYWLVVAFSLVLALFLAIVQFSLVWAMVLVFSLLIGIVSYLGRVPKKGDERRPLTALVHHSVMPWAAFASAVLCGVFLVWGAIFNTSLIRVFPVSSVEARPAFSTTMTIERTYAQSSVKRFLLGTGPQTFGEDWLLQKPAGVARSQFWNVDFDVGYSRFMTVLCEDGAVGAAAFVFPILLVLVALLQYVRNASVARQAKHLALVLSGATVYLWAALFFYVPSQNLTLLAFVFAGLTWSVLFAGLRASTDEAPEPSRVASKLALVSIIIVAAALILVAGLATRRITAGVYSNRALVALSQNNPDAAIAAAQKSLAIEVTVEGLRSAVLADGAKLQAIASASNTPTDADKQLFVATANQLMTHGQQLLAAAPQDYRGYLALGNAYAFLAQIKVSGAAQSALSLYENALKWNPKDPEIFLAAARLVYAQGDMQDTQAALSQALTLKPDYTDAILFVVQIDVANKDIPSAIKAAEAAVQSAPGVPSLWFELGLLFYTNNDTANAITALEGAVSLSPQYANAKYFLGLSYAAQNRPQDAINQFTDLQVQNPDNAEVKLILSNLLAGKQPFANAQPPVTPTPQARKIAPISQ